MQLVCPCCGARFPVDAALTDAAARAFVARLAVLSHLHRELPAATVGYFGCFRSKGRVLAWSRASKLLGELADAVEAGHIRRKGRAWAVTTALMLDALRIVVERRDDGKLDTPLRSHAYLYEVARGLSDKTEAAAERDVEERRRSRGAVDPTGGAGIVDHAHRYESLIDEARRLGVERSSDGRVKPMPELVEAVRAARAQEAAT